MTNDATLSLTARTGAIHPMDLHVGHRVRVRRIQCGLSQGALAQRLGLSFQAVQKYETGQIRISASRLYEVAQVLEVTPGFFFAEYDGAAPAVDGDGAGSAPPSTAGAAPKDSERVMLLMRSFNGIRSRALRADIVQLLRALAEWSAQSGHSPRLEAGTEPEAAQPASSDG